MNARHATKKDMARTVEMAWEQKKTNTKGNGTYTQGLEHDQPMPSQYRGHPRLRDLEGMVWLWKENGVYFEILVEVSFGKNALLG